MLAMEGSGISVVPLYSAHEVSGGHGGRVTPVPIPNTEVKPASADGTWGASPRESRTPPEFVVNDVALAVWRGPHHVLGICDGTSVERDFSRLSDGGGVQQNGWGGVVGEERLRVLVRRRWSVPGERAGGERAGARRRAGARWRAESRIPYRRSLLIGGWSVGRIPDESVRRGRAQGFARSGGLRACGDCCSVECRR